MTPDSPPNSRLGWTGGLRAGFAFMIASLALCTLQLFDCISRSALPDSTFLGNVVCGLILFGTAASVTIGALGKPRAFAASAFGVKLLTLTHAGWLSWRFRDSLTQLFACDGPLGFAAFSWNGLVLSTTAIALGYFGHYLTRDARSGI